ncbi:hypothetical protein SAMD00019534_029180 [Acytostelium subglobosum LB1]|uniref:hypothetical protein n=1 Tax=Acytostelium subglobosum LB1 TaxID=1410327 RepID=UPI00064518C0|nr:hypothetical protein SAMD00019534_029180 [Acytostelium subglobosum LB1]GAM19743.1 hypothetical protein SAMD00019534_029180 [Acytostelium subglobosum LB1]|eukprot:XP_012756505.1 hypothetical protein SAMD00019534_029180 [Acytostelium subglobosum LB1]
MWSLSLAATGLFATSRSPTDKRESWTDKANYCLYDHVEVYNIGQECVHFRNGSSHNTIQNSYIHDCGLVTPDYGEGVYVGSDKGKWAELIKEADYNTIRSNVIGPGVTAEHVDIKEGSSFTIVEHNIFNGTGITGANSGDSFIDVKGNDCIIRFNVGYSNDNPKVANAFEVHQRIAGWGLNANFYGNTAYLTNATQYVVLTDSKGNATASNNTRIPTGNLYSGNVVDTDQSTSNPTTSSTTKPSTTSTSTTSTSTTSTTTKPSTTSTSTTTKPSTTTTTTTSGTTTGTTSNNPTTSSTTTTTSSDTNTPTTTSSTTTTNHPSNGITLQSTNLLILSLLFISYILA